MKKTLIMLGLMMCMLGACGQEEETVEVSHQVERVREPEDADTDQNTDQDKGQDVETTDTAGKAAAYDVETIYDDDAFNRIIEGRETPVAMLYGQGGEGGYVTSDSDDPEVINEFIEAFRELKIKEVITDPDKMNYVMDGGEDIVFGLEDGSQVNIVLDGQRIRTDDAIYVLEDNDKLIEACHMMSEVAYMNEFGGPGNNYIAIIHGGAGERTYETYVYDLKNCYEFANVESTTVSYGSSHWNHVVKRCGTVATKEEVVEKAKAHGANSFVTFPGDNNAHPIEDFLNL